MNKSKEKKEVIGIDVSKLKLDITVHTTQVYFKCENNKKGINKMINDIYKQSVFSQENILFVFENTGIYSYELAAILNEKEIPFTMVSGLEVKRSLGIVRGKSDKADSKLIALFGYQRREELKPSIMPSKNVEKLQKLLNLRRKLEKHLAGHKSYTKELKSVLNKKEHKVIFAETEKQIKALKASIKNIEEEMFDIIKSDENIDKNYKLLTSINGIGKITSMLVIVCTANFTKFDNHRQLASYCGIAPFEHSSGSSVRGKTKVSNLAYKELKNMLTMAAMSAIQHNNEIRQYYERRIKEGKNKMSTLNNVRNKLLARMFSVVKRGTPYVDLTKYAA